MATICQPNREDIRAALLALTVLTSCRPALAQAAVNSVLQAGLDAGRTSWVLETLRNHLPLGQLTQALAAELTALAKTDRLSVRTLAGEVLEHHGRPVPSRQPPPPMPPCASLSPACWKSHDSRPPDSPRRPLRNASPNVSKPLTSHQASVKRSSRDSWSEPTKSLNAAEPKQDTRRPGQPTVPRSTTHTRKRSRTNYKKRQQAFEARWR